jgi:uncharacterized protein YndB with AHSA1/START domain
MNSIDQSAFTYTDHVAAPPEKVWEALTSPAATQQYWAGRNIVSAWKPGASIQMLKPDGTVDWEGEIITANPPRLLSYTFLVPLVEPGATEPPSSVRIELAPDREGTRLTLTHEGFGPESRVCECVRAGWPEVLGNLKKLVETGRAAALPAGKIAWK